MKQHSQLRFETALLFITFCWAPARLHAQTQSIEAMVRAGQTPAHIDSALRRMAFGDLQVRIDALHDLTGPFEANTGDIDVGVTNLLRAHPERAERIKLALVAALEDASATVAAFQARGENFDENISEYLANSIWAVSTLRDPRAAKALFRGGIGTGGMAANAMADLFPDIADDLIAKLREPARTVNGVEYDDRTAALSILKLCLTGQALVRGNPQVLTKVRKALLEALNDPNGGVRAWAASGLSAFRNDPEVRAKLSALASTDPHVSEDKRAGKTETRYIVRDAAARALASSNDADLFCVMRTPDTGECRVQRGSEPPVGEAYIGPVSDAKHQMCTHYDPASKDRFMCWRVYPQNARSQ